MDAQLARTPVYQQLNERIRAAIRAGQFAVGDRFWTERQVSAHFGVSRATANKALSALVVEGLLEFRPGVGTFVAPTLDYDLAALVSFTEKARAAGLVPSTDVISLRHGTASRLTPELRGALDLTDTDDLIHLIRLRRADGVPVILERRILPAERVPGLTCGDAAGSLYDVFTQRYQLRLGEAEEVLRAVVLDRDDATLLEVDPGTPALLIEAIGRTDDGRPLWHEQTLYRGDRYEIRHRLRATPTTPAQGTFIAIPPRSETP